MKFRSFPLWLIGLFQALGLAAYVSLIATFFRFANQLFGPVDDTFFAPLLALSLLTLSALVCALLSLGYPIYLTWEKKQTTNAFRLVGFTALWLLLFITLLITLLALT